MSKRMRALMNTLDTLTAPVLAERKSAPRPPEQVPGLSIGMSSDDTAELMIYGRIGGGGWFEEGISASDVAAALAEIGPAANLHVRINSGGGDAFDGVAIHTLLRRHSATVTTYIDGLAASAASFIAMAGDRVVVARGAMMMIHDAMTGTYGNGDTHRRSGDLLDKVSDTIADLYAARAGEDAAYWRALMTVNGEDGSWFTAQEAVDNGLADEMTDADEDAPATASAALRQWSAVLQRAPEKVRAALAEPIEEDESAEPETEPDDDTSDGDPAEDVAEVDNDFRFRMQMWMHHQRMSRTAA